MHVKFISNEKFEIKTVPRITDPLRTIVLPNGDKIAEIRWLTTSLKFLRYKLILVSDKKIYLKYVTFSINQSSVCINYYKNLFVKFCEYELALCGLENLGSTCYFNTFMQMLHTNLINLKNNLSLYKNKGPEFLPENNNTFTFLINYLFKGMKNNTLHKPEPYELIPWNRNEPKDFSHYLRFVFSKIYKDIPEYFSKLEYNIIYECNCKDYFFKNIFEIEVKIKETNSHFNSVKGGNVSLICYPEKITSSNFINEFTTNSQNDFENYSIYKSLENYFKIKKQCKVHEKEVKKYDFNLKNKGILLIKIKREEKKKKITDYFSYPNELTLKNTKYTLIGVVFHEGNVDNGHYFYVGKINESFYKFNDEMVSKCNLEDVFVYKNDDLVSYYLIYLKNEEIKCTSDTEENIFNNKIKDYDFSIEECPSFVKEEKKLEENEEIFMTEGQMEINLENKESKESIDLEHREESSPESESHTLFTDLNTNFYKFTREDIPKYLAPHFFCHDYPSVNLRKFYNLDKNDKYVYRFKINETSTEFIKDLRYENECIIYEIISESPFLLENERKLLNNNKINRRKKNNSIIKLETISQSSDTSTYQTNSTETVNTLSTASTAKDYTWQSNSSYKKLYFLLKMSKEGCSFLFPRKLQFLNHTLLSHDDLKRMNYYKLIHNGLIEVKNTLSDKINLIFDRYFIIIIEEKNDYLELRNKFRNNKCIKIEDNMIFVGRETKVNELEKIIQRVFLSSSIEIDWDGSLIKKEVKKEVKKESNIVSAELSSYVKKFTYEDDSYMNFLTCKSKENIFVEIKDRSIEGINKLKIIKKDTHCTVKVSFIEEKSDVLDCNKLEHIHYVYINKSITVRRLIHKINVLLCVKNEFTGCVKAVFNTDKIELLNLDDNIHPEEGTMLVLHNLEKDVTFLPCVYLNDNKFKGYPFFLNVRGLINIGELRMKYSISNVIVWKNSMIVAEEEDFFRGMLGLIEE